MDPDPHQNVTGPPHWVLGDTEMRLDTQGKRQEGQLNKRQEDQLDKRQEDQLDKRQEDQLDKRQEDQLDKRQEDQLDKRHEDKKDKRRNRNRKSDGKQASEYKLVFGNICSKFAILNF